MPPARKKPRKRDTTERADVSIWSARYARETPLQKNISADVCVVGAGIAGMTTAYLLARAGKSVVVLEKHRIGGGETSHTTAHLSNVLDAGYREIERLHGPKGAQLAAQSHTAAIAQIESIVSEEAIDCDFERLDGYLFLAAGDSPKHLDEELQAARSAGIAVEQAQGSPLGPKFGPCLRFPQQAQFHPLKYLAGLARAFKTAGGRIFPETEAKEIQPGKTIKIKTKRSATVSAGAVVVATNTPVNDWVKMHTKQAAYRTYVIGVPVAPDSIPKALYWDTEDPFHYARLHRLREGGKVRDVLIIGGEDHKTGQDEGVTDRFARLASWGRAHFRRFRRGRISLVRPGDGVHGRACVYRPKSRRRA